MWDRGENSAAMRPGSWAGLGATGVTTSGPLFCGADERGSVDFVLCQSGVAFGFLASCHLASSRGLVALVLLTLVLYGEYFCLADLALESGIWNA